MVEWFTCSSYIFGYLVIWFVVLMVYMYSCYKFLWNISAVLEVKGTFFDYREFARSRPLRCSDNVSVTGGGEFGTVALCHYIVRWSTV